MGITDVLALATKKQNQIDHGQPPHPSTHLGQAFLLYDHHLRSWEWEEHLFSGPINGCMVQSLVLLVPHLFKAVSKKERKALCLKPLLK